MKTTTKRITALLLVLLLTASLLASCSGEVSETPPESKDSGGVDLRLSDLT